MAHLVATQNHVVKLEDDLIMTKKWRKEVQSPHAQTSTSSDCVL